MTHRSDEGGVAVAVDTVWRQLQPALEQHYTAWTAAVRLMERRPGRRRTRRAVGLGLALAVVGTGGAVAARALLGDPAPPAVQASLAAVDEGMPADLRLQPDVANARSVARDGDVVLYAADLPDGGTCTELAIAGRPAGAICVRGSASPPIEASIPGTPEETTTPVVVGGRATSPRTVSSRCSPASSASPSCSSRAATSWRHSTPRGRQQPGAASRSRPCRATPWWPPSTCPMPSPRSVRRPSRSPSSSCRATATSRGSCACTGRSTCRGRPRSASSSPTAARPRPPSVPTAATSSRCPPTAKPTWPSAPAGWSRSMPPATSWPAERSRPSAWWRTHTGG